MTKNELKARTKNFDHRCIKLAVSLHDNKLGNHIQGQLIRCSSSVAANYRATCLAQSKKSFIAKLSIVIEESDESLFWIEFIAEEKLINIEKLEPLMKEADELTAIFIASRKTASK